MSATWQFEEALMSLMPPMAGACEDAWLSTQHRLFIRNQAGITRLAAGRWAQVPGGFAGVVDEDQCGRVIFVPMSSVIEAWQHTAAPPRQLAIEYEPEPF